MPQYYSQDPLVNQSLHYSVRDGIAWAVMVGIGEYYFAAFALFLQATTAQIAALASLPALLGSLGQFVSAWLLYYSKQRKLLILIGVLLQAMAWFMILGLPRLFTDYAVPVFIACVVVYQIAGHFASPVWSSLMGDLVPEHYRGRYFGWRAALINITALIALLTGGFILQSFENWSYAYGGFLLIFTLAVIARFYSAYQIYCMYEPKMVVYLPLSQQLQDFRQSKYLHFSTFCVLMTGTVMISAPFFSVYMLRDLHFTYLEYSFNTANAAFMQFATLSLWGRITDKFGNRLVLIFTATIIAILPSLWTLSTYYWYLIGLQMLGGALWAGFSLSASNYLYDSVVSEKRAAYSSVNNVLSALGVFLGASLGGFLATYLPAITLFDYPLAGGSTLASIFIISTIARLCVVFVFVSRIYELRTVEPFSFSELLVCILPIKALPAPLKEEEN